MLTRVLQRSIGLMVLLAAVLAFSVSVTASSARLKSLGNLRWVIEDELDCFINPALTALRGTGYLSVGGGIESRWLEQGYRREEGHGLAYLVLPPVKLFGVPNSFGGWVQGQKTRWEDWRPAAWEDQYTLDQTTYGFNLMDAVRLNERLAVAGGFSYLPKPLSRTYDYFDGVLSEHADSGQELHFEGSLAYRPTDQLTLEGDLFGVVGDSEVRRYLDGAFSYDYEFTRRGLEVAGKLSYAPASWLQLVLIGQNADYADRSDLSSLEDDAAQTRVLAGINLRPAPWLLVAGSTEKVTGDQELTALRGGCEVNLWEKVQLRGGIIRRSYPGGETSLDVTAGAGVTLGRGQLDLFLHPDPDEPDFDDSVYGAAELSYTIHF